MTPSRALRALAAALLLACALPPLARAQDRLQPVDEAARQPEFAAFRTALREAVRRRDVPALLAAVDARIRNSFGDEDGRAEFRRIWKLDDGGGVLWRELGNVLRLGGSFDAEGRFVAPYVFSRWPERADPFESVAIVAARVPVRDAPRSDAPMLGLLSFEVLPAIDEPNAPEEWTAVRLATGARGYVSSDLARGPLDYRAVFERIDGRWRMTAFIAGD